MQILDSIILGLVEGVTEFLPISSTGHLILTSHLLGLGGEVVDAFEVFIQLGAILAVVVLYWHRFVCLFDFSRSSHSKPEFKGLHALKLMAITSLPILIMGKLLEHFIKGHLFNPTVVSIALGVGGLLLILIERFRFQENIVALDQLDMPSALRIGLFQCAALCPGVSRAASTIIGGLSSGLKRTVAAEYSFLVAVPIMLIVCLKDLIGIWHLLSPNDLLVFALGFLFAFLSALVAVKGFIRLLQHLSLAPFGAYRIVVAVLFFWLLHHHTFS